MTQIYEIFRDVLIYRDRDRFVAVYAELLCGSPSRKIEVGGIKLWHPSGEIVQPNDKEAIVNQLKAHAIKNDTTYEFSNKDQASLSWEPAWDSVLERSDKVESFPFQFQLMDDSWRCRYDQGLTSIEIPACKPTNAEETSIIRLQPITTWKLLSPSSGIDFDKIKSDIIKWAHLMEFEIQFSD